MNINHLSQKSTLLKACGAIEHLSPRLPMLSPEDLSLPSEKKLSQEVAQIAEFIRAHAVDENRVPDTDIGFSLQQQVVAVSLAELSSEAFGLVSPVLRRFGVDSHILIHLIPEHEYNGFAAFNRFDGSFVIGVNSRLLDDFSAKQLAHVVGHECGHVMLKHPESLHVLANLAVPEGHILQFKYPSLCRRQEIVADRIGRLCCGDLTTALSTIKQTALQAKVENLEVELHKQQVYMFFDEEFDGYAPWLQSHPAMAIRAKALIAFEPIAEQIDRSAPIGKRELVVMNQQCEDLVTTMDHDSQKCLKDRTKYGLVMATLEQQFIKKTASGDMSQPLLSEKEAVDWLNIKISPGRRLRVLDYLASKTCSYSNEAHLQARLMRLADELTVGSVFQKRLAEQRRRHKTILARINSGGIS